MARAVSQFSCEVRELLTLPSIDGLLSVSCDLVNRGNHRAVGPRTGIRTAINAGLEEVSFRAGVMTGAITLASPWLLPRQLP